MEDPLGGKGARPSPSQMNLPVPHVDTLRVGSEELIALGLFEPQEVCFTTFSLVHTYSYTDSHTHIIVTFPRWSSMSPKVQCCVYICISIPLLSSSFFSFPIIISYLLLSQQKKSEEGDEILEELQKKQSELKAVVSPELQSILMARFDGLVFTTHYYTSFPSLSPSV